MLPNPLKRVALLIGALPVLALAGPVASASAIAETSQITSPAGPTYVLDDETLPPSQTIFTVEGTTNISGRFRFVAISGRENRAKATALLPKK